MGSSAAESVEKEKSSKVKPCFRFFHGTICVLMFCLGAALLGYSIYLQVQGQGLVPDLDFSASDNFIWLVLNSAITGIVIGAAMMVTSIVGLIAFNKGCCGVLFGIVYTFVMICILAGLLFIAVVTLLFATDTDGETLQNSAREVWTASVTDPEFTDVTCEIQSNLSCAGFSAGDCDGCYDGSQECSPEQEEVCPSCNPAATNSATGCYDAIVDEYKAFYLPVGIVSTVMATLVVVDIFTIWLV
mmetsp:Transcript_16647/g.68216  ORF Transcript_16647/g.68216 Transcript_16647/m.68216 type:complete len:244 (-) Transcript_16647:342-1073(-)|eukprot:CAMPEP_0113959070 /NCGR_PEP_ID=MMETSP0011_2-20120614/3933_1 /TAXON_ID=101924 /ORGANISM="Rhodosorus marinus" /LENGTH=243 /DNA_ID=CAMNT_0000970327 /DNA_START=132 /DNA_END=863 /DNA_ORIENTATION=- /assembly_acc=CAM_ASM_000156